MIIKKICFLLVSCFFILSAGAQENLAPQADKITTSFVSSWEKLNAINDGLEPASSGDKQGAAYGNWNNQDNNRWHWVEYQWNQLWLISKSEVYWWADGSGILIPSQCYLQYWDLSKKSWVELPGSRGPGLANQYHTIEFSSVLTNKIRVNMISSIATGILEWRVRGVLGEQLPVGSTASIDHPLSKGQTSTMILTAKTLNGTLVPGYRFKLNIAVRDDLASLDEQYVIEEDTLSESRGNYELPPTGTDGKISISVSLPNEIDPTDGISLVPVLTDGTIDLGIECIYREPGKPTPGLVLFTQNPTIDNAIEFHFSPASDWMNSVKGVYLDNQPLTIDTDYQFTDGVLVLKPSGQTPVLTHSGQKDLTIESLGFETVSVSFNLLPGEVDFKTDQIIIINKLFRGASSVVNLLLTDRFGNPVPGKKVTMNFEKADQSKITNEIYTIGTIAYSQSVEQIEAGTSGQDGSVALSLTIPPVVDLNDGFRLTFYIDGQALSSSIEYRYQGTEKTARIQNQARQQPDFSWSRTAQSDNFVLIWGEKIKGTPTDRSANTDLWFEPDSILHWLEEMYGYYSDSMKLLDTHGANISKYKVELVLNNTWKNSVFTGWAFGSQADNIIGSMWIDPKGVRDNSVLAHEFTHACQAQIVIDKKGYGLNIPAAGFFWESHANWTRAIYNHTHDGLLDRYINTSMMHFSVTRRHYQNFAFLDYVYDKYGIETVSNIWRMASATQSHPLTSFRDSVRHISQDELNDELALCAMHNVTWDYRTHDDIAGEIANLDPSAIGREYTILDSLGGEPGRFIVPEYLAPGDYGYNIIPLFPDEGASSIVVHFTGLENKQAGGAGSRFGFVAVDQQGQARYSPVYRETDSQVQFSLEPGDDRLFLVVTGAPQNHHNYVWEAGFPKIYRYPYVISFEDATPAGHQPGYNRSYTTVSGAPHSNGGGWVAATAKVDASVYVGPNACVTGTARVTGQARIEDCAVVSGSATVRDYAVVKNHAIVGGTSAVSGQVVVEKTSRVYGTSASQNVVITGSALVYNSRLSGQVIVKDLAWLSNVTLSGTTIVGGDAEDYSGCTSGTYLENKRTGSCDGIINHNYDQDINPAWEEYIWPHGEKPATPFNLSASNIRDVSVDLSWEISPGQDSMKYYLFQGGAVVATVPTTHFQVTGLEKDKGYTFQVQAVDRQGNLSVRSNTLMVKTAAVGSSDYETAAWFEVYPNPVENQFTIRINDPGQARVTVFDAQGRRIADKIIQHEVQFSRADLGFSGLYTLVINLGEKTSTQLLMVK